MVFAFAEEETNSEPIIEETTEEVVEENNEEVVVETEDNKSKAEEWLERYFGWVVGIPIGSLVTLLLEVIVLAKRSKQKIEELKETKDVNNFVKEEISIAKQLIEKTEELQNNANSIIEYTKENSLATLNRFDETDKLLISTLEQFSATQKEFENIKQILKIMAYHSKEYVSNGSAEEIYRLLGDIYGKEEV